MSDTYDVTIRIGGKEEMKQVLSQFQGEVVKINTKTQNAEKGVFEAKNTAERSWNSMQRRVSNLLNLKSKMDEVSARVDLTVEQKKLQLEMLQLQALQAVQTITRMVSSAWSLFKSTAELIGGGVDVMVDALVGFGLSAVTSLITIATGMMGNPWTAVLGAIALASAIVTLIKTIQAQNEMQSKKAEMNAKLSNQLSKTPKYETMRIFVQL